MHNICRRFYLQSLLGYEMGSEWLEEEQKSRIFITPSDLLFSYTVIIIIITLSMKGILYILIVLYIYIAASILAKQL
jgi:hypothetical protein